MVAKMMLYAFQILCLLGAAVAVVDTDVCHYSHAWEVPSSTCCPPVGRDCVDVQARGGQTGVHVIHPASSDTAFPVWCDMDTDGGGWLVVQRRQDGSVDFEQPWLTYERGFGDITGEFWLGLFKMYLITSQGAYEGRVDMSDFDDVHAFAEYSTFNVDSSQTQYTSTFVYSGDGGSGAGDGLTPQSGRKFSASDMLDTSNYCAPLYRGGWWYRACYLSNPNGPYLRGYHSSIADGVHWLTFRGFYYSLKSIEIKIRPV